MKRVLFVTGLDAVELIDLVDAELSKVAILSISKEEALSKSSCSKKNICKSRIIKRK